MKEIGLKEKEMERELRHGKMEKGMKVNIKKIKKMVMELKSSVRIRDMKDLGTMEKEVDLELNMREMEISIEDSLKME